MLAIGSIAASTIAVIQSGHVASWGVFWVSIMVAIFSLVISAADTDERFFGVNQRGLRLLRTTGEVVPARVLDVTTESQDENGNVFIRLRLGVAPPASSRFITTTAAKITVTDVPRFQPGESLAVRYLPQYSGAVAVERVPAAAQLVAAQRETWGDSAGLTEFSGQMPVLRSSAPRAVASVLTVLVTIALGAGIATLIVQAAS